MRIFRQAITALLGACPRIGCLPEKKSDVIAQYIDPEMLSQRNYDDNET